MNLSERTVKLLREIEWAVRDRGWTICVACNGSLRKGHKPDCELAALIAEHEKAGKEAEQATIPEAVRALVEKWRNEAKEVAGRNASAAIIINAFADELESYLERYLT